MISRTAPSTRNNRKQQQQQQQSKQRSNNKVWGFLLVLVLLWLLITWTTSLTARQEQYSGHESNGSDSAALQVSLNGFHQQGRAAPPNIKAERTSDEQENDTAIYRRALDYLTQQEIATADEQEEILLAFAVASLAAQTALQQQIGRPSLPLTAYLEHPLPAYRTDVIPRLASSRRRNNNKPQDLKKIVYNDLFHSCRDAPNDFPVLVPTVNKDEDGDGASHNECPVHGDPFLPWIHDAFVSQTADVVEVVAHNQRRCHTNPNVYFDRLHHLEPQVTLLQSVPIKRVIVGSDESSKTTTADKNKPSPTIQYQLTSLEDADGDAKETRFICQFHSQLLVPDDDNGTPIVQRVVAGETLSRYVYNYEHANYQKGQAPAPMLTRPRDNATDDKTALHNENVWNSILHFQCPIPKHLQPLMLNAGMLNTANIYVDIIPIRTYPRLDRAGYFDRTARTMSQDDVTFDPLVEWGANHVLPDLNASGRWANIPLCRPFGPAKTNFAATATVAATAAVTGTTAATTITKKKKEPSSEENNKNGKTSTTKEHFLVACVWASASFTTRGSSDADTSTQERLLEWLTYQLNLAGFDHVYIYDNSAPSSETTLEPVTSLFLDSQVTRIPWKHPVCNNNRPGSRDPGERNSQYAAETSCRIRYGPTTKWMAVFDIDEYFIPQAPYTSVKHWLETKYSATTNPTKILSFFQSRALPNMQYLDPVASEDGTNPQHQWRKKADASFLETYNCDKVAFPKPAWSWRAKKQVFQPSYVLLHFVHYSLVTKRLLDVPTEKSGFFKDHAPYEKRVDEEKEAFMLHAKTTASMATQYWRKTCKKDVNGKKDNNNCPIGIAFPPNGANEDAINQDGLEYNCYAHDKITSDVAPKLRALFEPLLEKFRQQQSTRLP